MKSFDWVNPYPSVRIPLFARNVVSCLLYTSDAADE